MSIALIGLGVREPPEKGVADFSGVNSSAIISGDRTGMFSAGIVL